MKLAKMTTIALSSAALVLAISGVSQASDNTESPAPVDSSSGVVVDDGSGGVQARDGGGNIGNGYLYTAAGSDFVNTKYSKNGGNPVTVRLGYKVNGVIKQLTAYKTIGTGQSYYHRWYTTGANPSKVCVQGFMQSKDGTPYVTKQFGKC
ncbi:hypothetical protein [Streptomyces sp. N35]|uniref:hypothetical protein n=1 Tax=Streptomyces sp. N35 TaxID=2795730 RepID=UPI0018F4101B|nr:hypothetical protein [Streptomyces sp. N35]